MKKLTGLILVISINYAILTTGCTKNCNIDQINTCKKSNNIDCLKDIIKNNSCQASIRFEALDNIASIESEKATDVIISYLENNDPAIREKATRILGKRKDVKALKPLLKALKDSNQDVSDSAAISINNIGYQNEELITSLKNLLKNEHHYIRANALLIAKNIKDKELIEYYMAALHDEELLVKLRAAEAINKLGDEGKNILINAYKDQNAEVRLVIIGTLGENYSDIAQETLIKALNDQSYLVRAEAARQSGINKIRKAINPLLESLNDEEAQVRGFAAHALGKLQAKQAIKPLIELLQNDEDFVKREAEKALKNITGEDFKQNYNDWINWFESGNKELNE